MQNIETRLEYLNRKQEEVQIQREINSQKKKEAVPTKWCLCEEKTKMRGRFFETGEYIVRNNFLSKEECLDFCDEYRAKKAVPFGKLFIYDNIEEPSLFNEEFK